jgi:hypothetical protein
MMGVLTKSAHAASAPLGGIGTVTVNPAGPTVQIVVELKGAAPNAAYLVCVADPASVSVARQCGSYRASTSNPCGFRDFTVHVCGTQATIDGMVVTDDKGNGKTTIAGQPSASGWYVYVWNTGTLGDSASATISG